jgi:UDP-N-acetylmuramate dehydrogenase
MRIDAVSRNWLIKKFGGNVCFNEPMARHTSLRVGGPAEAFIAPNSFERLVELVEWSFKKKIPYMVVGHGTNLLVKDSGIKGLVIVLMDCLCTIERKENEKEGVIVTAMAGARIQSLCSYALANGLNGMNFALGIPGTVGGGIMMNAGTALGSMETGLKAIHVLQPWGEVKRVGIENLAFSYRGLSWEENQSSNGTPLSFIIDGSFLLHPSDPLGLKKEADKIQRARKKSQPFGRLSAGCFFKNPRTGKTAGELIELAGLKEISIGGAGVSPIHANFIINNGNATAADILALMETIQEKVLQTFNIHLEEEVKIIGS